jgi:hypothetical protein
MTLFLGATINSYAHDFASEMKKEFEISMIGEHTYFLSLLVVFVLLPFEVLSDKMTCCIHPFPIYIY